jgi:hypothetical protein
MILIYSGQLRLVSPSANQQANQASKFVHSGSPTKKRHIPIERCSSLQMHVWWRCEYMSANLTHRYTGFNQYHSPSVDGTGRLRSHLLPPGAVGALYGSGCFHFSRRLSVSSMINCVGCWISISSCPANPPSLPELIMLHVQHLHDRDLLLTTRESLPFAVWAL